MVLTMERTTSLIVGPDGNPAQVPTLILTTEQAQIMREYKKKVLGPLGLREALYCGECWNQTRADGCDASVTDAQIVIRCRCKLRFFQGVTY